MITRFAALCLVGFFLTQAKPSPNAKDSSDYSDLVISWNQPYSPFKIVERIYFVGTASLAVYLIDTGKGLILLDTALQESFPIVTSNIERLGFKLDQIKIMISSHAHFDHVGGHAAFKKASHAQVFASEADAEILESGGRTGFHPLKPYYPKVKVDRRLHDGELVKLGDVELKAVLTPGHTEGNTAWTMATVDRGRKLQVVFASSMSVNPGVVLAGNKKWPAIAVAYRNSFAKLKELPVDIFLGPHTQFFDMEEKRKRLNETINPFIDPAGYNDFIAQFENAFNESMNVGAQKK